MSVEQIDLTSFHVAIAAEEEGDRKLEEHADSVARAGAGTRVRLENIASTRTGDLEKAASEAVAKIAEAEEEQRIARGRLEIARGIETAPGLLETARAQLASATELLKAAEAEGWRIEGEILTSAITITRKADARPRDSAPPDEVYAAPVAVAPPDEIDVVAALAATPERPDEAPMEMTATVASRRQMIKEALRVAAAVLWDAATAPRVAATAPRQQEAGPRGDLRSGPPAIEVLDAPIPEALQRDDAWTDEDDLLATLPPRSSRNMAKAGRTSYRELFVGAEIVVGSLMTSALILLATRG